MAQTGPLRECGIALIGQRFMGRAHSNAWSQAPKFFDLPLQPSLRTIAGRDAEALPAFARRWGWSGWTANWRDIAGDASIDLVDVATPNDCHAEQAIAMLEHGKHVACEKPLGRNLAEARAMRDAAQRAGSSPAPAPRPPRTFVWFNYRRCPAIGLAHMLVREGRLGRIVHVRAQYLQSWGGPETPMSWRFQRAAAGSGAHGDLNAHIVDLARFITGEEITEIHGAVARTFVTERLADATGRAPVDVDDAVLFLATLTGGAVASFEATRLAMGHLNRNAIEVNGEHGSVRFDLENMNVLEFYDAAGDRRTDGWQRIMCTRAGEHPYAAAWWPDGHIIGYEHTFTNMAADIMRALGGQEPGLPLPDFADAYETQRVLEAALISAEQRCAVPLSEVS
jgi:predicted dehydrogenase